MDDKKIGKDARRIDEEEQARRDRLDSLDGADWLRQYRLDADEVLPSGHPIRMVARHGSDKKIHSGHNYGRTIDLDTVRGYWERDDLIRVHGNHDDAESPVMAHHEASGIGSAPEPAVRERVREASLLPPAPRTGEILIGFFCGRDRREDMLAVLADKFEDKVRDSGARHARAWYWRQVARSFGPFAWQWVRRMVELDALLKLIGF